MASFNEPDGTTRIEVGADGALQISFTDTGRRTGCIMGGDVQTVYVVPREAFGALRAALEVEAEADLPSAVAERFATFLAIRGWLETHGIPFRTVRPFFGE